MFAAFQIKAEYFPTYVNNLECVGFGILSIAQCKSVWEEHYA